MFQLAIIKDTIPLLPATFSVPAEKALTYELNKKYANRILHDVGLCICVFDIIQAGEGKVRYGDGCLWHKVNFRLVVFRPFKSEVLLARVKSSDNTGIRLTLGFFDDIHVLEGNLPWPSAFDPNERAWFWLPKETDSEKAQWEDLLDSPLVERQYLFQSDVVRVRVTTEKFYDVEPGPPKANAAAPGADERRSPYVVTCSIAEQGLGLREWWTGGTEEA
ncbi:hypothetical protein EXIGLDRAFT_717572 [Exidia glandulosa HHB12029]|uniref:Polymerase III polypeptide H n=1 Tax=Exidia glandulosa HHB12029 TaxID=1314781 RepID=A0A165IB14_EXIGL|nr:hypothetical protein EXIGLDRAFT_717572 [Exidia glandulosa HHB12029]